jgi:hypothetical protein
MLHNIASIRSAQALLVASSLAASRPALSEVFVHQPITLHHSEWQLDLGLGIGHADRSPPFDDITGFGLNLELHAGLSSSLELGVRTGIRLGTEGRIMRADGYGRAFETETYGTGSDEIANPEVSLRLALVRTPAVALALEGRLYLPIEDGTPFGIMLAVPLHLHLGDRARLDSGIYVPIIFTEPTTSKVISVPLHLWFQVDPSVALGLLTGVRLYRPGSGYTVPLGVGLNYGVSNATDLRLWFLFPNVKGSGATDVFGLGIALAVRF